MHKKWLKKTDIFYLQNKKNILTKSKYFLWSLTSLIKVSWSWFKRFPSSVISCCNIINVIKLPVINEIFLLIRIKILPINSQDKLCNKTYKNKLNVFDGNYFEIGRNIQIIAMSFLQGVIYSFIYIMFQLFINSLMKLCSLSSVIWSPLQILHFCRSPAPTVCGEKTLFSSFVVNLFMCSISVFLWQPW